MAFECVYDIEGTLRALRGNCAYCNHWDPALHPMGCVCERCLNNALLRLTPPRPVRDVLRIVEDPCEEDAKAAIDLFAEIADIASKLRDLRDWKRHDIVWEHVNSL